MTSTEEMGAHRLRIYSLYDDDPATRAWLEGFYAEWWPSLAQTLRRYPEFLPDAHDAIARATAEMMPSR